MLTNKTHFATIYNFFENPEINIDKSSEHVKSDAKDKFKVLGNFFSKIIKTKAYKDKEDKKREIKLMIMLAKVDGIIEDAEKMFLSSEISHLDNFSVTEKKEFFSLMDAKSLPELSKKDIVFYSKERYDETMSKLVTLASKDGSFEPSEEQFINLVKEKYAEFTQKK
jgi:tellurite resistance protein